MVDEEPIRLVIHLAVLPQGGGDGFALLPGVDEEQTLLPPGVLVDVPQPRVGVLGGGVGLFLQHLQSLRDVLPFRGLDILHEEMLHAQPPGAARSLDFGNEGLPPGAQSQKGPGALRVAYRGAEANPPGVHPRQTAQPLDEAQGLASPVSPQKGVHLVNHHEPQIPKEPGDGGVLVQEQGLQRFGGNLQNPRGVLHELCLVALSHIPMPVPHRDVPLLTKLRQPGKLVVDQGFQGPDVDTPHGRWGILMEQGQYGEKGRLGFPGGSGGGEKDIFLRVKNRLRRRHLNGPKVLPVVAVNIILNKRSIQVKNSHFVLLFI